MPLLEMCQRVLAEVGWPILDTIASTEEPTAKQVLAIANTELRAISSEWDWPQLEVEYAFDTVVDQAQYAWPADFRKVVFGSVFDADQYYGIRGSMNIEAWNRYKYGLYGSISHQRFRQVYVSGAPYIELTPAPSDVRSLVATYMTGNFATSNVPAGKALFDADTDTCKVPEHLVELGIKWRFRRAKGLDYSAELAEYNGTVRTQFAQYKALGDIIVGGPMVEDCLTGGYVPDNGFGV